ncbi:MAG: hypothetical protein JNK64_04210 [Myxococcales bacterium]|nr:hypothetical protein [Myxococcales bacterium]
MRLPWLLPVLLAAACDNAPSSDYPTSETGIFVDVTVDSAGAADATVGLTADNPALLEVTYLRLEGGDALAMTIGGRAVALSERTLLGAYQYVGTATDVADRAPLVVAYDRADGQDAPATHGAVPDAFDLGATATRFRRADGLQLTFSRIGGADELVVSLRSVEGCFEPFTERGPATATTVAISPARFVLTPGGPATCNVEVTARAVAHGAPDPAFGRGGLVTLAQVRTLALTFDR